MDLIMSIFIFMYPKIVHCHYKISKITVIGCNMLQRWKFMDTKFMRDQTHDLRDWEEF